MPDLSSYRIGGKVLLVLQDTFKTFGLAVVTQIDKDQHHVYLAPTNELGREPLMLVIPVAPPDGWCKLELPGFRYTLSTDAKISRLADWLGKESECYVYVKWQGDLRYCRFYFEKNDSKGWRYILDVYRGDIEEQDVPELTEHLKTQNWRQMLEANAGKQVPYFMDKRFVDSNDIHTWPGAA